MSRACSSLMRLTDVIRSANCASDDVSAEPTLTSTANIEKSKFALALAQPRQPLGTDLRFAVGDNHDIAALEFLFA